MNNQERFWHRGQFYLVVLFFAFTVMIIAGALTFESAYKAALFPLLVGSVGLLLVTVDILHILIPKFGARFRSIRGGELFEIGKAEVVKGQQVEEEEAARPISILKTILWFISAYIIFCFLGYLLFSIVFLFLFLKFYSSLSLIKSLEITVGSALCLWIIFTQLLKLDIFAGSILF